jgi:hypothetical protein
LKKIVRVAPVTELASPFLRFSFWEGFLMQGRAGMGWGLALGIAVGAGIGVATHHVARGMSWGAVLGALVGLGLKSRRKPLLLAEPPYYRY